MAEIKIRKLKESTWLAIKKAAEEEHRSINKQAVYILERWVDARGKGK